jgi:hypothetical protein
MSGHDQWAELERLAKEATPGPWGVHEQRPGPSTSVSGTFIHAGPDAADDTGFSLVARAYTRDGFEERQHNAAFIAALNPSTVLKLIAAARAGAVGILRQQNEHKDPTPLPDMAESQKAVGDEMIERAAFAVERDRCRPYGWSAEQFEVWFNRDPNFTATRTSWGVNFTGTHKEKLFHEMRIALTAALATPPAVVGGGAETNPSNTDTNGDRG